MSSTKIRATRVMTAFRWPEPVTVVIAITTLTAVLRFATLDVQSVWLDEAIAMRLVGRSFGGMVAHLSSNQSTPPLYYFLAWPWTRIFGSGVVGFRSFSALVGTATVPLFYFAGRRFSSTAGLWTAALAAVGPLTFYYSQEIRPYALFLLFASAGFVVWQRTLERPQGRPLALWTAFSALALLTHYFAVFPFVAEAAVLARRIGWRRVVAPTVVFALVGVALVPLAVSQSPATDWIGQISLASRVAQTAKEFLVGPYAPLGIVFAPLATLLACGGLIRLWRLDHSRRQPLLDVCTVGFLSLALPALLAVTGIDDVFDPRNSLAGWIPWAIVLAAGLATARAPRVGAMLGAGLCAISALVIAGTEFLPAYQRDDWRDAAHSLSAPRQAAA